MNHPGGPMRTVSVVIPVWGRYVNAFLDEALESLLVQEPEADVIVVDNASSPPVRTERAGVRIIRTPKHVSCGVARNLGLEEVTTPMVVMWDADDVMIPGTLELLVDGLARDPGLVAYGAGIVEWPSGVRHRWPRPGITALTRWPRVLALVASVWSQFPTTGATVMRTAIVRDAGGYGCNDAAEDWPLGVALLWRGRVGWTERPGRRYRQHAGSRAGAHDSGRDFLAAAREVRRLLRYDAAVPSWCVRALPLIALAQLVAVRAVRPGVRSWRRARRIGRRAVSRTPRRT